MTDRRRHWLEKAQVQATAAVALAAVYFLAWPLMRPWDVNGALTFLATGETTRLAMLLGIVALVSLFCAALTLQSRPEGAVLTVLVALAGLSFRSGQMRTLLWRWPQDPRGLFWLLALETLVLALVLLEVIVIVQLARALARQLWPRWVWAEKLPDGQQSGRQKEVSKHYRPFLSDVPFLRFFGQLLDALHEAGGRKTQARGAAQAANALLLELAVALVMLICTFRSSERGQIAFAVAASFFVGALVAHQAFPSRGALAFWIGPILLGLLVYVLGALTGVGGAGPTWHNAVVLAFGLPIRSALPIDWLTMGAGGALAGFWLSRRLHHARYHLGPEKEAA